MINKANMIKLTSFIFVNALALTKGHDDLIIQRHHPNVIPPRYLLNEKKGLGSINVQEHISNTTLRQFLSDEQGFHLGIAPAFYGYYVYFGALTVFQESVLSQDQLKKGLKILPHANNNAIGVDHVQSTVLLKSVAGASAGAMASVLLSSGLSPRHSAEFVSNLKLSDTIDPIGIGGILKGDLFEETMRNYLRESKVITNDTNGSTMTAVDSSIVDTQLEDGIIPIAVTAFDLLSFKTKTLNRGSMARAARASACFPILFQPVSWNEECDDAFESYDEKKQNGFMSMLNRWLVPRFILSKLKRWVFPMYLFIDGGIEDPYGLVGLASFSQSLTPVRVVNLSVGTSYDNPPGPSQMPNGVKASAVLSLSIDNAPPCGPNKMSNGPRAVQAAIDAVTAILDVPMYYGAEKNHYILHIDAAAFIA